MNMSDKKFPNNYPQLVCNEVTKYLLSNRVAILDYETLTEDELSEISWTAQSIIKHREDYATGGGFCRAIVNNDLKGVIDFGDKLHLRALKFFVQVNLWLHIK